MANVEALLTKKLGPAPVWMYGAGALAFAAILLLKKKAPAQAQAAQNQPPFVGDTGGGVTGSYGSNGGGGLGGGNTTTYICADGTQVTDPANCPSIQPPFFPPPPNQPPVGGGTNDFFSYPIGAGWYATNSPQPGSAIYPQGGPQAGQLYPIYGYPSLRATVGIPGSGPGATVLGPAGTTIQSLGLRLPASVPQYSPVQSSINNYATAHGFYGQNPSQAQAQSLFDTFSPGGHWTA